MGDGGLTSELPPSTKVFDEVFPYYLSIGMTYELFWEQDCLLVKAYRRAEEYRQKRINEQAWLNGRYVYDALCAVSPILHAFAKNGTEPRPYLQQPYPSNKQEMEKREEEQMRQNAEMFEALVRAKNEEFRKRKEAGSQ